MILSDQRRRVDEVDRELVRLLNRRAQMSMQIAELKREVGLPARDFEREDDIFRNVRRYNAGPLDTNALTDIFRLLLAEARRSSEVAISQADGCGSGAS